MRGFHGMAMSILAQTWTDGFPAVGRPAVWGVLLVSGHFMTLEMCGRLLCDHVPLAGMYLGARTLRLADGPDEVHKILIAKNVLRSYADGDGWDFGN